VIEWADYNKMIPISLSLSNFMPYGRDVPALSFVGIHVASICGDNGSGKSSLIDAITWALWGKSRARSDDDLIRQHQTNMQVQFDFAVGQQVYRIIRKHDRPKNRRASGQSSLDLLIASSGGFKPISGDRMSETEKKVTEILHMDYDTFVNSAFLRQGHADQFTVAKPTERKTVLTSILGLSTYDQLEMQARQMAGKQESDRTRLENTIRDIGGELAHKPVYEQELQKAEAQLDGLNRVILDLDSRLTGFRRDRDLLKAKQQQLTQLDEQITRTSRDLRRWSEQAQQHRLRATDYETLLADRQGIEERHALLVATRRQNEELNQRLRLITALRERQRVLDITIEQSNRPLLREHALAENRVNELQTKYQKTTPLRNELQTVRASLAQTLETERSLEVTKKGWQDRQLGMKQLETDKIRLDREIVEIDEKLGLLATGVGARCPLCEQELGDGHLDLIRKKYDEERRGRSRTAEAIAAQITQAKRELGRLEHEVVQKEGQVGKLKSSLEIRIGILNREATDAEGAGRQLDDEQRRLKEVEERLARKDYAIAEQEEHRNIDVRIESLEYDSRGHEDIRLRLVSLEQNEAPMHRLGEADRHIGQVREAVAGADLAAKELGSNLEEYQRERASLAVALQSWPAVVAAVSQAELEYQQLTSRQHEARETLGSARERLNRCAQLEETLAENVRQQSRAAREEGIYRELTEAFGKRGVQALLIEIALPEIETEANRLLARMTDNRMRVRFETQRETRKGDILETLDINIADELGTRSYEMFSGGEAFRINFAIRIALSKLLARRAGAPLPTLIIDEGFGTQDAHGMEKIREAITSVQDDFDKILVITHIEEFRDAFPVRIEVVKTPEGSTIEVN
jgi:exonuclease SbcC